MTRIKKVLLAALIFVFAFGSMTVGLRSCYSPSYYMAASRSAKDIVKITTSSVGAFDQATIDKAWKEAIEIGGGDPTWKVSVDSDHIILVPSTLGIGPYIYYGITVTQPVFENGVLRLVETIEIHLAKNMQCHSYQVLVHEMLHTVATRRQLTDHDFAAAVQKAGDEETWVRQTYPIADMGLCK